MEQSSTGQSSWDCFNHLPEEIWIEVFVQLPVFHVLVCSRVSKLWYKYAREELLWERLCDREFGVKDEDEYPDLSSGWMDRYIAETRFHKTCRERRPSREEYQVELPQVVAWIRSGKPGLYTTALIKTRKALHAKPKPAIDDVVGAGLAPDLVRFLGPQFDEMPRLQKEAAWAVLNVAAGTVAQCHAVLQAGAVPAIVRLLPSPHYEVVDYALWALGNIASDNTATRNELLTQTPVVRYLVELAGSVHFCEPKLRATAMWTCANLLCCEVCERDLLSSACLSLSRRCCCCCGTSACIFPLILCRAFRYSL